MPDRIWFHIGGLKVGPLQLLILAWGLVFFVIALKLSRMYWNRKLTQWAESQHLQLVNFRGAWFYEGPSAWTRSRNQHVFRVTTRNAEGLLRTCWIMFGTYWGFTWGEPITKVEWVDSDL